MSELTRFIAAQDAAHDGLEAALAELGAGRKQGHWVWYVFPQLAGLGESPTARRFAIRGREEATAYLAHEALRTRLLQAIDVVWRQLAPPATLSLEALMGSRLDARKLVSSLTLFEAVATDLATTSGATEMARVASAAGDVLTLAADQGVPRCAFTLAHLHAP
ncbi:DUF1810 family protein [Luteitalea sp.]|uniref:DUF1810 family protein n=1 Tax=Luteitalea sp. TaxID=2004800 RepID=UPI000AAFA9A6|nr:DUF1810 family protein [Luteitalea sp.]